MNPNSKVIISSGFFEPEVQNELIRDGICDILQKPYSIDDILIELKKILQ